VCCFYDTDYVGTDGTPGEQYEAINLLTDRISAL
jgi:hypothetical protein